MGPPSHDFGPISPTASPEAGPEAPKPPAGGFGATTEGQAPRFEPHRKQPGAFGGFHVVMIALGLVFLAFGTLVGWGEWKRAKAGRRAEAINTIGWIGKLAVEANDARGALCPSAGALPRDFELVRGKKYQPTATDLEDAGWKCLEFDNSRWPTQYQYRYEASPPFVTIIAVGDLDGNDLRSTYELRGHVDPTTNKLVFEGAIRETNPGE